MNTKTLTKAFGGAALLLALIVSTTPSAQGQVVKRDFQDWLDAQNGAYSMFPNDDLHLFPVGKK